MQKSVAWTTLFTIMRELFRGLFRRLPVQKSGGGRRNNTRRLVGWPSSAGRSTLKKMIGDLPRDSSAGVLETPRKPCYRTDLAQQPEREMCGWFSADVAQLDRASAYEAGGCRFESCHLRLNIFDIQAFTANNTRYCQSVSLILREISELQCDGG